MSQLIHLPAGVLGVTKPPPRDAHPPVMEFAIPGKRPRWEQVALPSGHQHLQSSPTQRLPSWHNPRKSASNLVSNDPPEVKCQGDKFWASPLDHHFHNSRFPHLKKMVGSTSRASDIALEHKRSFTMGTRWSPSVVPSLVSPWSQKGQAPCRCEGTPPLPLIASSGVLEQQRKIRGSQVQITAETRSEVWRF